VFIAMEYFPLGDLQPYLSSPLPEKDVQQITYQILEGLLFMHDNGFVHRDLKPNVSFSACPLLNITKSCRTFLCNPKNRIGG
jgi:serine/threonine protein kinase